MYRILKSTSLIKSTSPFTTKTFQHNFKSTIVNHKTAFPISLQHITNQLFTPKFLSTMSSQSEIDQLGVADAIKASPFSLPQIPYSVSSMEPDISTKTMSIHYGKHHAGYVRKLNDLVKDKEFAKMTLEDVIKNSQGAIFNNAAQHWNHTFFWKVLSPQKTSGPYGPVSTAIDSSFGSFEAFKEKFVATATGQFGSGWAWVVKKADGSLACEGTPNGINPISTGSGKPVMALDVWEHAYYLDYQQDRAAYVKNFFNVINWDTVNSNYE